MTLVHTALLCEALPLIEKYKLKTIRKKKEFLAENLVVIVSGIGKKNTQNALHEIFKKYTISKAINIGIAGCSNKNIPIGSLFCTSHKLDFLQHASLSTVQTPRTDINTTLVDMEAQWFALTCKEYGVESFVFKVVSDYLDDTIPAKNYVTKLIKDSLDQWKHLL